MSRIAFAYNILQRNDLVTAVGRLFTSSAKQKYKIETGLIYLFYVFTGGEFP